MKLSTSFRRSWLILATLLLACTTWSHEAQAALINISLSNTSQLPTGTGFLLQYTNNNGLADNNSVIARDFVGLTATGSPEYLGTASGNLNGTPSSPRVGDGTADLNNEFFQTFTPSANINTISFNFDTRLNSVSSPVDSFTFSLLQQDGATPYATTAPDGISLFTLTFNSLNNPTVNDGRGNFSTNDPSLTGGQITATVTTAPVPEPSTWVMMALGLGALGLIKRRKRGETQG